MHKTKPWLLSTGPRTAAGKKKVSQNRLKHGKYTAEMQAYERAIAEQNRQMRRIKSEPNEPPQRGRPPGSKYLNTLSVDQRAELESFDPYANAIEHGCDEKEATIIATCYETAIGPPPNRKSAELWLHIIAQQLSPARIILKSKTSAQIAELLLDTVRVVTTR